jgi:hypothetical protein
MDNSIVGIIRRLQTEKRRILSEMARVESALAALDGASAGKRTKGLSRMSLAGRERIAAAQRARWARFRKNSPARIIRGQMARATSQSGRSGKKGKG